MNAKRPAALIAHGLAALRPRISALTLARLAASRVTQVALFFALVVSSRLFFLHVYGVDLPYSDQWDSEGWNWLKPYQDGGANWSVLFLPHNEHRIVFIRLLSLALFVLNDRQWDNLVSATVDVFFVGAVGSLAARAVLTHLSRDMWPLALLLLAACCLPCGYENLLIGFQAQIYFLIALTVLGVWLVASKPLGLYTLITVGTIAAASLFTLASGLFTPLVFGLALALRLRAKQQPWHAFVPLAAILLAATIAGYLLLVTVPNHQSLHAQNPGEWFEALRAVGSWPLPASWIAFALVWLPFAVGTVILLVRRESDAPGIAAVALGVWTALQIASIAYGRAHDMTTTVHSRYTDMLALTVLVNAFFCLRLLRYPLARAQPNVRVAVASIWLTILVGAYAAQGAIGFIAMQQFGESRQSQADTVRRYVQGINLSAIDTAMTWNLPYPDKQRLKMMLNDRTLRDILPASTRPQLALGAYAGGFSVNGMPANVPKPQGRGAYGTFAPKYGSDNTASMTATGLHSRFPYLQFAVAGYLGAEGLELGIESVDGTRSRSVVPSVPAGEGWSTATVGIPSPDFILRARDENPALWFAFTAPTEVGRLSMWTGRLLDASPALLFASLLALYFIIQQFWLRQLLFADPGDAAGPTPRHGGDTQTARLP